MSKIDNILHDVIYVIIFSVIFVGLIFVGEITRKLQNNAIDAENAALQRECDSLKSVVTGLQTEKQALFVVIDSLKQRISDNSLKINVNKKQYEKDIERVSVMGDVELLRFFTEYTK